MYTCRNKTEVIAIEKKEDQVNGNIEVTYKVVNQKDLNLSINLEELLKNEKIVKIIKNEFAKGHRNIDIKTDSKLSDKFKLETIKEHYTFTVLKDDFADLLTLAEDDATSKKLLKKDCFVELVDIKTNNEANGTNNLQVK
jgi:hypothetical protein